MQHAHHHHHDARTAAARAAVDRAKQLAAAPPPAPGATRWALETAHVGDLSVLALAFRD